MKPNVLLKAGEEYQLVVEGLSDDHFQYLSKEVSWTTGDFADLLPPSFFVLPKENSVDINRYGCGDAMFVKFEHEVCETSAYLVKTTVISLENGSSITHYPYEVEFSLMDASGNYSKTTSGKISFIAPFSEWQYVRTIAD